MLGSQLVLENHDKQKDMVPALTEHTAQWGEIGISKRITQM